MGVRPRYYSDNGEDALIMTTEALGSPTMRRRVEEMTDRYGGDWLPDEDSDAQDDAFGVGRFPGEERR